MVPPQFAAASRLLPLRVLSYPSTVTGAVQSARFSSLALFPARPTKHAGKLLRRPWIYSAIGLLAAADIRRDPAETRRPFDLATPGPCSSDNTGPAFSEHRLSATSLPDYSSPSSSLRTFMDEIIDRHTIPPHCQICQRVGTSKSAPGMCIVSS